jgi:ribosome maturation factor RimP
MKGTLETVDGDLLTVLDEDRNRRYTVRFGDVKVARLVPEY